MNILVFDTSYSSKSLNIKLLSFIKKLLLKSTDAEVEYLDLKKYDIGLFNEEDIENFLIPENVKIINQKIIFSDALIISTSERAGSMTSNFKNLLDWLSFVSPLGLKFKNILLVSCSEAKDGGLSGFHHTKFSLEALENFIYPKSFILGNARHKFDDKNNINDFKVLSKLQSTLTSFVVYCQRTQMPFSIPNI